MQPGSRLPIGIRLIWSFADIGGSLDGLEGLADKTSASPFTGVSFLVSVMVAGMGTSAGGGDRVDVEADFGRVTVTNGEGAGR